MNRPVGMSALLSFGRCVVKIGLSVGRSVITPVGQFVNRLVDMSAVHSFGRCVVKIGLSVGRPFGPSFGRTLVGWLVDQSVGF